MRAQLELMAQDSTRVSAPDWTAPFSSLEDAVDRLLPYHVSLAGCWLAAGCWRSHGCGVQSRWSGSVTARRCCIQHSAAGSCTRRTCSGTRGCVLGRDAWQRCYCHVVLRLPCDFVLLDLPTRRTSKLFTLPQMFGAEDPAETDAREAEGAPDGGGRLATSRHEAWQDHVMHRVNEYGAGLVMLDKRIRKAEAEALQRSQLPLLMLQSYATAEAQALGAGEVQRRIKAEHDKKAAIVRAQQEEARKQQEALEAQQRQQQSMADRLQQQQAMAAAAQQKAAAQQQQMAAAAAQQQQQQQQQQPGMATGIGMLPQQQMRPQMPAMAQQAALQQPPPGLQQRPPMMQQQMPMMQQQQPRPPGFGMAPPGAGLAPQQRPAQPPGQQQPQQAAKLSKAEQLAAMRAKIAQRK